MYRSVPILPSSGDRPFLTVEEAAAVLGISRTLAYSLANEFLMTRSGLPCVRLGSRRIVVPRAALERWTRNRGSREVMLVLQARGIEAARVQTARDLMRDDEHLAARGYFQEVMHLIGEVIPIDGMPFRLSATPATVRSPGPIYGADNDDVFHGLLGLALEEVRRLQADGVIA